MSYPKLTPIIAKGTTEPRYLENRFADLVNVKDFGAKGDGVTDDTNAVNSAIIAGYGKTVFFPAGVYKVTSTVVFRSNTKVVGAGKNQTTIRRGFVTDNEGGDLLAGISRAEGVNSGEIENVWIEGIAFDCQGYVYNEQICSALKTHGVVQAKNIDIVNCKFIDIVELHAIDLVNACDVNIINCDFEGYLRLDDGVERPHRESIQFDFGTSSDDDIRTRQVIIDRCRFGPSENLGAPDVAIGNHGVDDASSTQNTNHISVTNCYFASQLTKTYSYHVVFYVSDDVYFANNYLDKCGSLQIKGRDESGETPNPSNSIKILNNHFDGGSVFSDAIFLTTTTTPATATGRLASANKNIEVSGNKFENYNRCPVYVSGSGVDNLRITNNNILNCTSVFTLSGTAKNIFISNNYINGSGGIYTNGSITDETAVVDYFNSYVITHNIFVNPTNSRVVHLDGKNKGALVVGNIVDDDSTTRTRPFFVFSSDTFGVICSNNIIFSKSQTAASSPVSANSGETVSGNKVYLNNVLQS